MVSDDVIQRLDAVLVATNKRLPEDDPKREQELEANRVYRLLTTSVGITGECLRCHARVPIEAYLIVAAFSRQIPITWACLLCGGEGKDEDGEPCERCNGRGWRVVGALEVWIDLVCESCATEERGSASRRAMTGAVVYTVPNRAGEGFKRVATQRLRPMCKRCQQRYAFRNEEACKGCLREELRQLRKASA